MGGRRKYWCLNMALRSCLLVNLYREGREFDTTDSRGYINLDDLGVKRVEYHNDCHYDNFLNMVADSMEWRNEEKE